MSLNTFDRIVDGSNGFILPIILDDIKGYNDLWFLGDNFMATTYRNNYKKATGHTFFTKENYEVTPFCNSRFNSNDRKMLSRFRNTLATVINDKGKLLKYLICVMDADLVEFLNFHNCGIASIIGNWLEWIMAEMKAMITTRKEKLPPKAVKADYPQIYWVAAPLHMNFTDDETNARRKLNLCMQSIMKQEQNMRVIQLKEYWDSENLDLVNVRRSAFTDTGLLTYWRSIDASVRFNVCKHEDYIKKSTVSQKAHNVANQNDPMHSFFQRVKEREGKSKRRSQDKFHWTNGQPSRKLP